MALSPYERRSLVRFMAIYLGAVLLVVLAFSLLFYRIDSESVKERIFSHLRMTAMQIAASAVDAQMQGKRFTIPEGVGCDYLLLDTAGRRIDGCIAERVDPKKEAYTQDGCAYYVDRSARGHLGIGYIVVRDCSLSERIALCRRSVVLSALAAFGFLVLVGWYLGRLFLRPMREKIESMDRFIHDSTHELNTPVTTMLLALEKIERGECRPAYLRALQMSGRLIAKVYEDLTFLLLRERQAAEASIERLDVAQKVRESLDFFSILADQKRLEVRAELRPCRIEADPHHIALLVKNLIDNAVKYTRPGGTIEVTLEGCRLSVRDNGIGIRKQELGRIFGRFERANGVEGGLGIGLDIVATICRIYGFGLDLRSEEGSGSQFVIDFSAGTGAGGRGRESSLPPR